MKHLNFITAAYLKLLELVSVILIALGEKLDPLFSHQRLSSEHPQQHLHPQQSRWPQDDQHFECSQPPSSSDPESVAPVTPDYYFDRYNPRSPFYDHFPDSDNWYGTFIGLDNHHGPDPFDSY